MKLRFQKQDHYRKIFRGRAWRLQSLPYMMTQKSLGLIRVNFNLVGEREQIKIIDEVNESQDFRKPN